MFDTYKKHSQKIQFYSSVMLCNIMESSRGKLRNVRIDCLGHWTPLFHNTCHYRLYIVAYFMSCHIISERSVPHFLQE